MASSDQPVGYRFGSFVLDLEWGGLRAGDGSEIPLRPKSFALLRLLAENAGRILSQDAIMTALWPNLFVTENNVTQCIHDIRRALGPDGSHLLQTVPRRGYRFTSEVATLLPGARLSRAAVARPRCDGVAASADVAPHDRPTDEDDKPARPVNGTLPEDSAAPEPPPCRTAQAASGTVGRPGEPPCPRPVVRDDKPADFARGEAATPLGSGQLVVHGDGLAGLRYIARQIDLNTALHGSIRGILDRLAKDARSITVETAPLQSQGPDIRQVVSTKEQNDVTYRIALTLLMKIIEGVNRQTDIPPPED